MLFSGYITLYYYGCVSYILIQLHVEIWISWLSGTSWGKMAGLHHLELVPLMVQYLVGVCCLGLHLKDCLDEMLRIVGAHYWTPIY